MKNQDLITILAGAVLAYVAYKTFTRPGTKPQVQKSANTAAGMFGKGVANSALPGQPGFGWDYYDNGVAISPEGTYYLNGAQVWSPQ